jgi:hypothetical protein
MDTGFPDSDARDDFARARRSSQWARLIARLRGRSGDVELMLPYDEVVTALGRRGQRDLGRREVPLDAVVGSVDRTGGFDRAFRPTDARSRQRFERIAAAVRRGADVPAIDVYQVGEAYFVRDGHHRVAVLRALGRATVAAQVVQILTVVGADRHLRLDDLPLKSHERLFRERVPLPAAARSAITVHDPDLYATLAEGVEAWGYRTMQARGEWWDRKQTAEAWFRDEFIPTVTLLRQAGLMTGGTDAEVFLRLSAERYRLARSHDWDADTLRSLGGTSSPDAAE